MSFWCLCKVATRLVGSSSCEWWRGRGALLLKEGLAYFGLPRGTIPFSPPWWQLNRGTASISASNPNSANSAEKAHYHATTHVGLGIPRSTLVSPRRFDWQHRCRNLVRCLKASASDGRSHARPAAQDERNAMVPSPRVVIVVQTVSSVSIAMRLNRLGEYHSAGSFC